MVVSLSDQDLIEKYRATDDLKVLATLYHRYTQLVAVLCMKYLKNRTDSEDAATEIFELLIRDLKVHEVRNFKAWLFTVIKNHCFKRLRKAQREGEKERDFQKTDGLFMESSSFEDQEDESQVIDQHLGNLPDALNSLKVEQKTCVELFYLKEMSYKEVVEETGYDLKKVKSYIQNGKRNLAIYFNEHKT